MKSVRTYLFITLMPPLGEFVSLGIIRSLREAAKNHFNSSW